MTPTPQDKTQELKEADGYYYLRDEDEVKINGKQLREFKRFIIRDERERLKEEIEKRINVLQKKKYSSGDGPDMYTYELRKLLAILDAKGGKDVKGN